MPGVKNIQDIIALVKSLKSQYDVPVGIKIAGTDYIEYELAVIAQTNADFITLDGSEGGTSSSPPTLQDHVGLPTLHTLVRAVNWLNKKEIRDLFSLIIVGGLATPGHFLKALALGADAVYIGTIALMAAMQSQVVKTSPQAPPSQLALYSGKMNDKLDIEKAAKHLSNFLKSCVLEMQLAVQAVGKKTIKELNRSDLVTVDKEVAKMACLRYAYESRSEEKNN
jgi:glutamate synthase domain-containing protein 2